MKRFLFLLAFIFLAAEAHAASTGCTFPSTLDVFTDGVDAAGWSLTLQTENIGSKQLSFNKIQCAVNNLEAELGTLPKGSYATVKARLDDAVYLTASQTLTNKTLTSPVIQGTITPGSGMAYSLSTSGVAWTWAGNTSTTNLFALTDGASNTGTGVLAKFSTASGSAVKPFQADNNGNGLQMSSAGLLGKIGTGGIDGAAILGANPVPIGSGGTGQVTAALAYAALSPVTTKGDLISRDGSAPLRLGVGANDLMLVADSAEASGLRWGNVPLHATGPGLSFTSNKLSLLRTCADQEILKWSSGTTSWVCTSDNTGGTPSWNSIGNPSANQALTMGAFVTTWTWGAATGTSNLFALTDTTSNTGTGYLLHATTQSGSLVKPSRFDSNGNGVEVTTAGLLQAVGGGGIDAGSLLNTVALNRGGTNNNSWTASRCVQVNAANTALEPAAAGCAASPIIDRVTSDTTVTNTASETTVYSFSVPGGTLSTNVGLRLKIFATFFNQTGSDGSVVLRLKYGSTTIGTVTQLIGSSATTFQIPLDAMVMADGATNAQYATIRTELREDNAGDVTSLHRLGGTTATEDSTAAKNLVVTAQLSGASSNLTYVMRAAILEKL